jgi:hypothetical protein
MKRIVVASRSEDAKAAAGLLRLLPHERSTCSGPCGAHGFSVVRGELHNPTTERRWRRPYQIVTALGAGGPAEMFRAAIPA